jgi:hypothetical protein
LDRREKEEKYQEFIASKFSLTTWMQLHFLYKSFGINHSYIELELNELIKEERLSRIHRFRAIHVFSRLMSSIETLLAMIYIFSKRSLKSFGGKMLRYNLNQIDQVISDISNDRLSGKYQIFGFPKPSNIELPREDQRFLYELFLSLNKELLSFFKELAQFYQNHRSAYGKLKHGLMFHLDDLKINNEIIHTVITLDRHEKNKLYADHYTPSTSPSPPGLDWYNLVTLVPQNRGIFKKYLDLNDLTLRLARYIITNYMDFASNCGKDYLPRGIESILQLKNEIKKLERYEKIKKEVQNRIHITNQWSFLQLEFKGEASRQILERWRTKQAAVFWHPLKKKETTYT